MSSGDKLVFDPDRFQGRVRLFPLPNLVVFPHVLQPLHVFEPRYRELTEEALAGDRLIAMAVLAPGWESDYEGRPAVYPVACLGHVATFHRLEDGKFNLLLAGLARVRLKFELAATKSFREALVDVCPDEYPADAASRQGELYHRLVQEFRRVLPKSRVLEKHTEQLFAGHVPLGVFTDVVSFAVEMKIAQKEQLLRECNVEMRAALLLQYLSTLGDGGEGPGGAFSFPPEFSKN